MSAFSSASPKLPVSSGYSLALEQSGLVRYRVTCADTDADGVVYHSRYLEILERGRTELFRQEGQSYLTLRQSGVLLPLVECSLRYHLPAKYDDLLMLETRVIKTSRRGIDFSYTLYCDCSETRLLTATTRHLFVNESGHSCSLAAIKTLEITQKF